MRHRFGECWGKRAKQVPGSLLHFSAPASCTQVPPCLPAAPKVVPLPGQCSWLRKLLLLAVPLRRDPARGEAASLSQGFVTA